MCPLFTLQPDLLPSTLLLPPNHQVQNLKPSRRIPGALKAPTTRDPQHLGICLPSLYINPPSPIPSSSSHNYYDFLRTAQEESGGARVSGIARRCTGLGLRSAGRCFSKSQFLLALPRVGIFIGVAAAGGASREM
jgi:hypothetical protein